MQRIGAQASHVCLRCADPDHPRSLSGTLVKKIHFNSRGQLYCERTGIRQHQSEAFAAQYPLKENLLHGQSPECPRPSSRVPESARRPVDVQMYHDRSFPG